jgi:hypothetical protein
MSFDIPRFLTYIVGDVDRLIGERKRRGWRQEEKMSADVFRPERQSRTDENHQDLRSYGGRYVD